LLLRQAEDRDEIMCWWLWTVRCLGRNCTSI